MRSAGEAHDYVRASRLGETVSTYPSMRRPSASRARRLREAHHDAFPRGDRLELRPFVHPLARSLCNLECIIGQLWATILARLVTLELRVGSN